jgi:hypothetical protein
MLLAKIMFGGVAAIAGLAATSTAALSATAFSSTALNVRSGPGANYAVVDRMNAGERVNVDRCIPGFRWCHVQRNGADGWVSAAYLRDTQRRPLNQFAFNLNIPQLGFTIALGQDGLVVRPGQPPQPPRAGRACFYEHANYQGRSFCAVEGQANARLGATWNDRISSIRLDNGAEARVCEHWGFEGRCRVVTRDLAFVGQPNNDIISSYRVM